MVSSSTNPNVLPSQVPDDIESNFGTGPLYPMKIKLLVWEASLPDKSTYAHVFFKNSSCPIRWTLIVYNSMVRSKLIIVWSGHPRDTPGTPIKTWSLPVERFTTNIKCEHHLHWLEKHQCGSLPWSKFGRRNQARQWHHVDLDNSAVYWGEKNQTYRPSVESRRFGTHATS